MQLIKIITILLLAISPESNDKALLRAFSFEKAIVQNINKRRLRLTPESVMAIVMTESSGRPCRRKPGMNSQFYGLFQMGNAAAAEASCAPSELHCNKRRAVYCWFRYAGRYRKRLDEVSLPVFWKCGVGCLKRARARFGNKLYANCAKIEKRERISNVCKYIARYEKNLSKAKRFYRWRKAKRKISDITESFLLWGAESFFCVHSPQSCVW